MTESIIILKLCFQFMVLSSRYDDPLKIKHLLEKCNVTSYHVANRIIYEWETWTCTFNQEVCRSLFVIFSFHFWRKELWHDLAQITRNFKRSFQTIVFPMGTFVSEYLGYFWYPCSQRLLPYLASNYSVHDEVYSKMFLN